MIWNEIHETDQLLTLEINSWSSSVTDPVWQLFSSIPAWIPMYVLIVAGLIWKLGWKKGLLFTAAAALTFGFCDQFSGLIKDAVCRVRPLNDAFMISEGLKVLEKGSSSFSFFSAHAANAFGLACCTTVAFRSGLDYDRWSTTPRWLKAYTIWMIFWAAMVAISRVFVGKHYLGDVLAGALVGLAAGYAFARLAAFISKRL